MTHARKLAAIVMVDIVGFSRLTAADEDRTLARVRALRGDLVDPTIAAHRGRVVKGTGDGVLAEFRSAVDAVRAALELQTEMKERNLGLPAERRMDLRIGIHRGETGGACLSAAVYEQVRDKLSIDTVDLGSIQLKNIIWPIRVYSIQPECEIGGPGGKVAAQTGHRVALPDRPSIAVLPLQEMSAVSASGRRPRCGTGHRAVTAPRPPAHSPPSASR